MVVDDDPDIRETITEVLQMAGFEVMSAENGQDALDRLQQSPASGLPDFLFLDLMMPVMDGWRLRQELQRDGRLNRIPVVAVSASTEKSRIRATFEGYLEKPVDLNVLLHTAESYCHP
jgi:CheY-like chemotaxis protein